MKIPADYPFDRLRIPAGEQPLWRASNPTFHRGSDYGIVITDRAIYLRGWLFSLFTRWRRIAFSDITQARFHDSRLFPRLALHTTRGVVSFRTPYDTYRDEMDWDRDKLMHAACFVEHLRLMPPPAPH